MSYDDIYKQDMIDISRIYFGGIDSDQEDLLLQALDYSMQKRYKEIKADLNNNYTNTVRRTTIKKMVDFINDKKPIMTSYGTLFMQHGSVPNPLSMVVQGFLDKRGIHKKQMFEYPKGSLEYEHYNLLQSLDKINANSLNCISI